MKPDDELLKKKKKRPSRFVRFIFVMIFIIAIVSLIFYSVDNPGFIPSIKDKIVAFYTSDESTATDSSTIDLASKREVLQLLRRVQANQLAALLPATQSLRIQLTINFYYYGKR